MTYNTLAKTHVIKLFGVTYPNILSVTLVLGVTLMSVLNYVDKFFRIDLAYLAAPSVTKNKSLPTLTTV
jgi:hypothetical protein